MAIKKKAIPKKKIVKLPKNIRGGEAKLPTEKEVNKKINDLISVFMKDAPISSRPVQYQSGWHTIMPVYVQCLKKIKKLKLKCHPMYWGIKKLTKVADLERGLKIATEEGNVTPLYNAIYIFLLWFTDKKK